jgi:hypothetical protein
VESGAQKDKKSICHEIDAEIYVFFTILKSNDQEKRTKRHE